VITVGQLGYREPMAARAVGSPGKVDILLVDDDKDIREVICEALEPDEYMVRCAEDGETAIAELRAGFRPHVILLDLMMPGMDGREFRRLQLANPEWATIPVVVMSAGNNQRVGLADSLALRKPFDLDQLLEIISVACDAPSAGAIEPATGSGSTTGRA
jgi:CheY-like chemotaxis protein